MASPAIARRSRFAAVGAALVLLTTSLVVPASAATPSSSIPVDKALFFSSDGMRPDLMETYAAAGAMPNYQALMNSGVRGVNGMQPSFPPNTGVGWYTMMTGTWPSEFGSTNNTFHRTGDTFSNRTSFSGTGVLQADTLAEAAERAGKKVAQIDWVGGAQASQRGFAGPTVDFVNFFSNRGILLNFDLPGQPALASSFGVSYQRVDLDPASGWTNVPASYSPAKQEQLKLTNTAFPASNNVDRFYDLYIFDSTDDATTNYDRVLVVPATAAKDGNAFVANLAAGDWQEVKVTLVGARAGQAAGFYLKAIDIAPDLSQFRIYFTSTERVIAFCSTSACNALPAGGAGENKLEKKLAEDFPSYISADFAPLEARIIDEDTYVEQGRDREREAADSYLTYILGTLQPNTDVAFVGYPVTDEFSHQFMALYTPTDMDGDPNPTYDDSDYNGIPDGRVTVREGYVRSAYHEADAKLGLARSLLGGNPTTFAGSDHGFAPQWFAVNARKVLFDTLVSWTVPATATTDPLPQTASIHASGGNTASNCGATNIALGAPNNRYLSGDITKACWAGGTIQIYVNPTLPAGLTYGAVRTAVVNAFNALSDPGTPGAQVVDRVMLKEELRNVQGVDALHPNRSGDVVVVLRPPYQSDAGTPAQAIALSQFFGQHGYLPELVDLAHNVNMHSTFVAAGPGIRKQDPVAGVRAIDLAPTIAFLLGIPGPQNARGRIMYNLVKGSGSFKEITILDISDYHGQLVPLSEASDTVGPSFAIGGSSFLKPWFDWYRAEAPNGSLTMAAGDSVGATPPISAFFGDTPTIELMNLMGIGIDGLGNHNFDKGSAYLRNTIIPLANYPFVSSNLVDVNGNTPAEWNKSVVFDTFGGVKVGIVGFSNDDLVSLIFPGNLDPFHVESSIASVNAEVAKLKTKNVPVVIAIGHLGATAGSLTNPTGELITLADGLTTSGGKAIVDAVIGDHTNFQVITTRPNGALVTENLSKGVRFTRVRLVYDPITKKVIYKTADFHKPWDIGVTPDPTIQARLNNLNTQLQPILGTVIGSSSVEVLRSDVCGRVDGRLCESLVGDIVTDAMRTTYASIDVEFAITNSGGLRDRLTCPPAGGGTGFCPAFTPPPYLVTRGQVLAVLPFGNVVSTLQVNGSELKTMLENGVSLMPAAQGRFPQVSGLCFTYDLGQPAGSRVTGAVRQAADGSCTGTAIDLTSASTYTIAENDFMASGGDGYPNFFARQTTQNIMDQVVADYITANSPLNPAIQARIHCTDSVAPNDCPAGSP